MAQGAILMMFVMSLTANLGLYLAGGWLITQGERFLGPFLIIGAFIYSWLMWEAFVWDEDTQ